MKGQIKVDMATAGWALRAGKQVIWTERGAWLSDDDLLHTLSSQSPTLLERALKEFLDSFSKDYRENIAKRPR